MSSKRETAQSNRFNISKLKVTLFFGVPDVFLAKEVFFSVGTLDVLVDLVMNLVGDSSV